MSLKFLHFSLSKFIVFKSSSDWGDDTFNKRRHIAVKVGSFGLNYTYFSLFCFPIKLMWNKVNLKNLTAQQILGLKSLFSLFWLYLLWITKWLEILFVDLKFSKEILCGIFKSSMNEKSDNYAQMEKALCALCKIC